MGSDPWGEWFSGGLKAWHARTHVIPGSPVQLPKQPPDCAQAEVIFLSFQTELKALRKPLITTGSKRLGLDGSQMPM